MLLIIRRIGWSWQQSFLSWNYWGRNGCLHRILGLIPENLELTHQDADRDDNIAQHDGFFNLVNQFLCTNFEYVLLTFYFDLKKMSDFVQAKSKTIFSKGIESEKWREGSGKPIHSWSTPSDSNKGSVIGLNALRWSDQSLILCSKLSLKFWEAAAKVDNYQVSLWQKQLLITEVHKLVNFL